MKTFGYINNAVNLQQISPDQQHLIVCGSSFYIDSFIETDKPRAFSSAIDAATRTNDDRLLLSCHPVPAHDSFAAREMRFEEEGNAFGMDASRRIFAYYLALKGGSRLEIKGGDVLVTSTLINFSRDLYTVLQSVAFFVRNDIRVVSIRESFDTFSGNCSHFLHAFPAIDSIHESIKAEKSIQIRTNQLRAKKEGKAIGRRTISVKDLPQFGDLYRRYLIRELSKTELAAALNVSRPTLDKLIAEYRAKNNW